MLDPADEKQANIAWRAWFRGYMEQYTYDTAGDAVRQAFLAGVEWAWTKRDISE